MSTRAGYAGASDVPRSLPGNAQPRPPRLAPDRGLRLPDFPAPPRRTHPPDRGVRPCPRTSSGVRPRSATCSAAGAPRRTGPQAPPQPGHRGHRGRRRRGGRRRPADHRRVQRRRRHRPTPRAPVGRSHHEQRGGRDHERRRHGRLHLHAPTTRATRTSPTSAPRPRPRRPRPRAPATLLMSTNQGDLTLTLDRATAPCAAASFTYLASQKFFDGSPCHREVNQPTFGVLQCGDPTGTGSGGPSYKFAEEVTPRGRPTRAAPSRWPRAGRPAPPAASSSCASSTRSSAPDYTAVGTVDEAGLAVLDTDRRGGQRRLVRGPGRRRRPEPPGDDQHDDRRRLSRRLS